MITLTNDDILILMKWTLSSEIHGKDFTNKENLNDIMKNILLMRSKSAPQEVILDLEASSLILDETLITDDVFNLLQIAPNIIMNFFERRNESSWTKRIKNGDYTEKNLERLMKLVGFELSLEFMGANVFSPEEEEAQFMDCSLKLWEAYQNGGSGFDVASYVERYTNGVRALPSNLKFLLKAGPSYHTEMNTGRLLEEDMKLVREHMANK